MCVEVEVKARLTWYQTGTPPPSAPTIFLESIFHRPLVSPSHHLQQVLGQACEGGGMGRGPGEGEPGCGLASPALFGILGGGLRGECQQGGLGLELGTRRWRKRLIEHQKGRVEVRQAES